MNKSRDRYVTNFLNILELGLVMGVELEELAATEKPKLSEREMRKLRAEQNMLLKYIIIEATLLAPAGVALMYQISPQLVDRVAEFLIYLR